ncbi:hypothetical protein GDO81_025921 [Engystomops pustulosus]|uniref:Uncharacterized protein n=1 Tax=Engystomops pustulosus TaxID=76066 RepID=A0AAV6YRR6_ENGPU|nr:hypothetical protein GDO81_025921 [Engystomops pustulosus]
MSLHSRKFPALLFNMSQSLLVTPLCQQITSLSLYFIEATVYVQYILLEVEIIAVERNLDLEIGSNLVTMDAQVVAANSLMWSEGEVKTWQRGSGRNYSGGAGALRRSRDGPLLPLLKLSCFYG